MKFGMLEEVDECTTVCSMTQSKVKVTSPSELEIRPFKWELATDRGFLN